MTPRSTRESALNQTFRLRALTLIFTRPCIDSTYVLPSSHSGIPQREGYTYRLLRERETILNFTSKSYITSFYRSSPNRRHRICKNASFSSTSALQCKQLAFSSDERLKDSPNSTSPTALMKSPDYRATSASPGNNETKNVSLASTGIVTHRRTRVFRRLNLFLRRRQKSHAPPNTTEPAATPPAA